MIRDERDVRDWVRSSSGGMARWVEPALGSTPGLPDCWVVVGRGRLVQLELKVGDVKGDRIRFTVRPEQRREIKRMVHDRVPVGIVLGIRNTESLMFLLPTREALAGNISVTVGGGDRLMAWQDRAASFWPGVNFIFSDSC